VTHIRQLQPSDAPLDIPVDAGAAPHQVLTAVLVAATKAIPQIEQAGMCVVARDGELGALAVSDPLVDAALELQRSLGEGPCLETIDTGLPVIVENAHRERRWPAFTRELLMLGVHAELALPLVYRNRVLGAMTLCWTRPHTLDVTTLGLAEAFAVQAAVMLGATRKAVELEQGMLTRQTIGQAIGLLMGRYDMDADSAFGYLRRMSQTHNVKLRDVALEVVQARQLPAAYMTKPSRPE